MSRSRRGLGQAGWAMSPMRAFAFVALATLLPAVAKARPLTPTDLVSLSRVANPTVSADGHWLVWQQHETELAANRGHDDLWRRDLKNPAALPEKFAAEPGLEESDPEFGGDGWLYFLGHRDGARAAIWRVDPRGGPLERVTGDEGIDGFRLAPRATAILVWAMRPTGARTLSDVGTTPLVRRGSARIYDQLPVRFWNAWSDGERSQLFVAPLANGRAAGPFHAIEGRLVGDCPSRPFGGREEVAWSSDGRSVYFTLREAGRIEPMSTNFDVFAVLADGSAPPVDLTRANGAIDTQPAVSPDGHWLAWLATAHPGYENDRQVVMLREIATGRTRSLTADWDRSVDTLHWLPDSSTLYVTAEDEMNHPLYRLRISDGRRERLTAEGNVGDLSVLPSGRPVYALDSLTAPTDLWTFGQGDRPVRLTEANATRLAGVTWPDVSRFSFAGAQGDPVHGIVLLPPGESGAKVPTILFVHGGPQNSFSDRWSYLVNTAVLTGHGFGVVAIDFHGSTGHGQAFTDSIHEDWGGKPLVDLQRGLADALTQYPRLDGDRVCAQGGSYGGFMMNWIEGQWPARFRCLIQADGPFDTRAMTYETDDLRADEWDFGDHPYHEMPDNFEKWSPVHTVGRWRTPMLVLTGERDYRTPSTQAIAAFTALQQRNIPSRLVAFPDEGHWTTKPWNSLQSYSQVLDWLDRFIGGDVQQPSSSGSSLKI